MSRATVSRLIFMGIAAIALACTPGSVFAQRGGGHGGGGGGFHGGGGGFSGGFRGSSGGSFRSAPSYSRATPSYSRPSGNSFYSNRGNAVRGGNSYRPPTANRAPSENRAPTGNFESANAGERGTGSADPTHDGQWHYFGSRGTLAGNAGPNAARPNGGESNFAASIPRSGGAAAAGAGARSFVGQGRDVYEESARAGATSAATSARAGALSSRSTLFGARALSTPAATATLGSAFGVGLHPVLGTVPFGGLGRVGVFPGSRFGFAAIGPRFGFGGFGFGLGWGLGFNSCWGAAWAWDPFCSAFAAWPGYGGYYAYPPSHDPYYDLGYDPNYDPGYDPNASAPPNSDYYGNGPGDYDGNANAGPVDHNWDSSLNVPSASRNGNAQASAIIYMKDGTWFTPSDYWLVDDQLHFVLGGRESAVDLDRVDLARSNEANEQNGVKFWLKSEPNSNPGAEDQGPAVAPAPVPEQNDAAPGPASSPAAPEQDNPPATLHLQTSGTA